MRKGYVRDIIPPPFLATSSTSSYVVQWQCQNKYRHKNHVATESDLLETSTVRWVFHSKL
jgi:hypothetical protein